MGDGGRGVHKVRRCVVSGRFVNVVQKLSVAQSEENGDEQSSK